MEQPNIVIIGASGHAKVVIDIVEKEGKYNIVGLIDTYKFKNQKILGYTILGREDEIPLLSKKYKFKAGIIAIGDNWIRGEIYNRIKAENPKFQFITTIHPSAILGKNVTIGIGNVIMPGAIINADSKIDDFCIINTKVSVGHDCTLQSFCSLASGSTLGGNVIVKRFSAISIGAIVLQNIKIGKHSVIGAGSLVTKNIDHHVVVYGVPAKFVRKRDNEDKYLYKAEEVITEESSTILSTDKLKVITKKNEWDELLAEVGYYDFYHTYDYHYTAKLNHEKPFILKYESDGVLIALPLLLRKIEGTTYSDANSVYGYPGPLCKGVTHLFDNASLSNALQEFFEENNIISVFSRMNPYIPFQETILKHYGTIVDQGKVVNIDITLDLDSQKQNYQRRLKTHINKAKRNCYVKKATTDEDIEDFVEIYHENMGRVNAKKYYYFGETYFNKIKNSSDFETIILLAKEKKTNKTIAACMFIITNGIVQYHLSGSKNDYLHLMPTKLLIDEMRLIATEKGYQFFNLGGGLGGRDDDSLFAFKSSFSKDHKTFKLWKLIVDHDVYDYLVDKNQQTDNIGFFPKYRPSNS